MMAKQQRLIDKSELQNLFLIALFPEHCLNVPFQDKSQQKSLGTASKEITIGLKFYYLNPSESDQRQNIYYVRKKFAYNSIHYPFISLFEVFISYMYIDI